MKISKYSCIVDIQGVKYFLNTYNSALIQLDDDVCSMLSESGKEFEIEKLDESQKSLLIEEGFLVDDDEDRIREEIIKMGYHSSKYMPSKAIKIDIGITNKCNFACAYCFENGNRNCFNQTPGINEDIELFSEVRNYILENVRKGVREFKVVWYGGEPSLKLDFITHFNKKIIDDSNSYGFDYSNIIVTNGYSIEKDYIEKLQNQNVEYVQVTLDGPKNLHNERRNTNPKTDSYGIIMNNIGILLEHGIQVVIRINIDKTNISGIEQLLDDLSRNIKTEYLGSLLFVTFGRVFGSQNSFTNNEYETLLKNIYIKASKLHLIIPSFEVSDVKAFCSAETANENLVIDFAGNRYKCWNDIFNTNYAIENILNRDEDTRDSNDTELFYMETLSLDNVNNGKCLECELIKYCGGLCPYSRRLIYEGKEENIYLNNKCKEVIKDRISTYIESYLMVDDGQE